MRVRERYDEMRQPVVDFEMDSQGSKIFSSLTGKHIGEPLAIVIDERVESAPTIESRIPGRGKITMGGGATIGDAYLLAVMLKAGALPADVEILQSTLVGPALGQDSINKGKTATSIGLSPNSMDPAQATLAARRDPIAVIVHEVILLVFMSSIMPSTTSLPGKSLAAKTRPVRPMAEMLFFGAIKRTSIRFDHLGGYLTAFKILSAASRTGIPSVTPNP